MSYAKNKIRVIKVLREETGAGLKDCKDAIDGIWPEMVASGQRREAFSNLNKAVEEAIAQAEAAGVNRQDIKTSLECLSRDYSVHPGRW